MSGGVRWEGFEIDDDEYDDLVDELQRRGTKEGRFGWGSYEIATPPSSVETGEAWRAWRRDERQAECAQGGPIDRKALVANLEGAVRAVELHPQTDDAEHLAS